MYRIRGVCAALPRREARGDGGQRRDTSKAELGGRSTEDKSQDESAPSRPYSDRDTRQESVRLGDRKRGHSITRREEGNNAMEEDELQQQILVERRDVAALEEAGTKHLDAQRSVAGCHRHRPVDALGARKAGSRSVDDFLRRDKQSAVGVRAGVGRGTRGWGLASGAGGTARAWVLVSRYTGQEEVRGSPPEPLPPPVRAPSAGHARPPRPTAHAYTGTIVPGRRVVVEPVCHPAERSAERQKKRGSGVGVGVGVGGRVEMGSHGELCGAIERADVECIGAKGRRATDGCVGGDPRDHTHRQKCTMGRHPSGCDPFCGADGGGRAYKSAEGVEVGVMKARVISRDAATRDRARSLMEIQPLHRITTGCRSMVEQTGGGARGA
ncbi:hypothetical protein C8R45DRAFT_1124431 [Mycena sanguinolenta]|nr:hypothetical protein C8R45DRAFT_1124431 [Mycena sanguinolenta]